MAKIKLGTIVFITILLFDCLMAQTIVVKEHNENVQLWMEAEAGDIASLMMVYDNEDASGGQFIEVSPGNNTEKMPQRMSRLF